MKQCYTFRVPGSPMQPMADLTPGDTMGLPGKDLVWINRINVPQVHRGKGYGSQLLKMVTDDADAQGVHLALEIYSSGPLSHEDLEHWYARNGFQYVELRIPQTKPRQVYPCWVRSPAA